MIGTCALFKWDVAESVAVQQGEEGANAELVAQQAPVGLQPRRPAAHSSGTHNHGFTLDGARLVKVT